MMIYYGTIIISQTVQTEPGIWVEETTKIKRKCNVVTSRLQRNSSSGINDNFTYSNTISISADKFIMEHLYNIVAVEYGGNTWNVSSVAIKDRKIQLIMGELRKNESN